MSQIFFHEPDKYQGLGNKCTNYNSEFNLNKPKNLSSQDHLLNILFTLG